MLMDGRSIKETEEYLKFGLLRQANELCHAPRRCTIALAIIIG